jgi:hypothetical protein
LTANYGLSPTFYLDGYSQSVGDVYTWPKAYSVGVSNVPNYVFDHFSYRGGSYSGNPTTIGLFFEDTLTAHYNWNPTYYTLSISSSSGGHTEPSGQQQYLSYTYAHVQAVPDPGYVLDYWLLDGQNAGNSPSIDVYMNNHHSLQAFFTTAPSYWFVSSIDSYGGYVYSPNSLAGYQPDGRFAQLQGYGQYQDAWIVGVMNAQAAGRIYLYGFSSGYPSTHLYVYVSNGGIWNYVSDQYLTPSSPQWIDCGTSLTPFSYILIGLADDQEYSYLELDAVRVEPPVNHTLTISSGSGGSTNPLPGAYQYAEGTLASVTAIPESGYVLDYWLLDGQNVGGQNPITVTMNSDHNLQAVFRQGTYYWLTVDAYDGYAGNPVYPNIYVDGNWAGCGYAHIQVTEGWHTVWVDEWVWNEYLGCYDYLAYFTDGYGNGSSRPVYADTYLTAIYYPWW